MMINNYQRLLHLKRQNYGPFFLIVILIIALTIYICQNKIYDYANFVAVSDTDNLLVTVPISYSDTIHNAILKIKNQQYEYTVTNISELLYDANSQTNYQIYTIHIAKKYLPNEMVKVTFYYNQEKIIKKLIRFIKE